jgi:hypothetical protein
MGRTVVAGGRVFDGSADLKNAAFVVDGDPFAFVDLADRITAVYQDGGQVAGRDDPIRGPAVGIAAG